MAPEDLRPKPTSRFIKVRCKDCSGENLVFDRPSTEVRCLLCGAGLATPTGGKLALRGEFVEAVE